MLKRAITVLTFASLAASPTHANVIGNDGQNFNPDTGALDFVTVHSSETLDPGYIHFGLFLNHAVNTLPYFEPVDSDETPVTQSRTQWNDTVTGADLNIGIGLLEGWDVGISLPQILAQSVENDVDHGQWGQKGNTEIRLATKLRLIGDHDEGIALVGSININRTAQNPFTGLNPGPTTNLEIAADSTWNDIAYGANLGYRYRQPGEAINDSPIIPFSNQWLGSVAASYQIPDWDTKIIGEVFASLPAKELPSVTSRAQSSAEALLGLKYDWNNNLALHGGAGTELFNGMSSPDWRLYAGLTWTTGPVFKKPTQPLLTEESAPVKRMAVPPANDPFVSPPKPTERVVIHDVLFEFGSDELTMGDAYRTLERLALHVKKPPQFKKLVIEGHTCSIGNPEANRKLSLSRAERIKEELVTKFGLDSNKIVVVGYGASRPISSNSNYQGRQLNRRVEFKILR